MKADLIHPADLQGNNPIFSQAGLSHTGGYWSLSVFHWQKLLSSCVNFGEAFLYFS